MSKPSSNLSGLLYERDGQLFTDTQRLATVFKVDHELLWNNIAPIAQPVADWSSIGSGTLEPIELNAAAFEDLFFSLTRRLYWRATYTKILKLFEREAARLNSIEGN